MQEIKPLEMMDGTGCAANEPFALRVMGDSMEPEFDDGAIIIIDPAGVVESGAYVLAMLNDEYIFRQYIVEDDGRTFLKPLNSGYESVEIERTAIKGVIVQKAGTRRHHRKHYV